MFFGSMENSKKQHTQTHTQQTGPQQTSFKKHWVIPI